MSTLMTCPQCGVDSNESNARIIRDSCGHFKCRMCLLQEDLQCASCDKMPPIITINHNDSTNYTSTNCSSYHSDSKNYSLSTNHIISSNHSASINHTFSSNHTDLINNTSLNLCASSNHTSLTRNDLTSRASSPNYSASTNHITSIKHASLNYPFSTNHTSLNNAAASNCIASNHCTVGKIEILKDEYINRSNEINTSNVGSVIQLTDSNSVNVGSLQLPISNSRNNCIKNKTDMLISTIVKCERLKGTNTQSLMLSTVDMVTKKEPQEVQKRRIKSKKREPSKRNNSKKRIPKNEEIKKLPLKPLPAHITTELTASQKKRYICTICNKKFMSRKWVEIHSYCDSSEPLHCTICQQYFDERIEFYSHMNMHPGRKVYICDVCEILFYQQSKIIRHILTHNGPKAHKCTQCDAKFNNQFSLKKHTLIHSGLRPYVCSTCNMSFRDSSNLRKHQLKHMGFKYECDICGKKYSMGWSLKSHYKTHSAAKHFGCTKCLSSFYTKKDLQRHELIHIETKPFQCSVCDIFFRRKDNLDRHIRNAHTNPKVITKTNVKHAGEVGNENGDQTQLESYTSAENIAVPKISNEISHVSKKNTSELHSDIVNYDDCGLQYSNTHNEGGLKENYPQSNIHSGETAPLVMNYYNEYSNLNDLESLNTTENCLNDTSSYKTTINKDNVCFTHTDILEANSNRKSVICSLVTENTQKSEINNYTSCEDFNTNSKHVIDYSQKSLSTDGPFLIPNVTKEAVVSPEESLNLLNYEVISNKLKGDKFKSAASTICEKGNQMIQNNKLPFKHYKQTINVNDVYKKLLSENNEIPKYKPLNETETQVKSYECKQQIENKPAETPDKISDVPKNRYSYNKQPPKLQYIHKKVHYDMKKYSDKYKHCFSSTTMLPNSKKYDGFLKETATFAQYATKKDYSSTYLSPESIELYKKILIPSYKSSSETATAQKQNLNSVNVNDKNLQSFGKNNQSTNADNIPPLVQITNNRTVVFDEYSSTIERNNEIEQTLVPQLVPLEPLDHSVFLGKRKSSNSELVSPILKAVPDDHWKRRLVHNSDELQ